VLTVLTLGDVAESSPPVLRILARRIHISFHMITSHSRMMKKTQYPLLKLSLGALTVLTLGDVAEPPPPVLRILARCVHSLAPPALAAPLVDARAAVVRAGQALPCGTETADTRSEAGVGEGEGEADEVQSALQVRRRLGLQAAVGGL
jgi:hypothetical protein